MKFWIGILTGIVLGVGGAVGGYFYMRYARLEDSGVVVIFTEEDIQARLGEEFPKSERLLEIIPVEIGEPKVRFLESSDRVELTIRAEAAVPLVQTYHAEGIFTTSLRYEASDHTLRISDVTVESFKATDLPEKFEDPLRKTMTLAAKNYLENHPVHTLDDDDYKDEMVKMLLKKVTVTKGTLEVKLGL